MPSAPRSTFAPGHSCHSRARERVQRERVAAAERAESGRRVDRGGKAGGRAVEVPLRDLVAVDPDLEVHHLWVDLVGGHHARTDRDRHPLAARDRRTARVARLPVVHERVAEQVSPRIEGVLGRGLETEHGGDLRLVFEPRGAVGPRHLLLRPEHSPFHVERPRRQQRRREQGGQDARPFDAPVEDVVTGQGGPCGIHDGASAARDETLERGGEGRMPDCIGQVDHLTLEDRPQSPLPPAVVGDEPHVREPKRTPGHRRNHAAERRFFGRRRVMEALGVSARHRLAWRACVLVPVRKGALP